MGRRGSQPGSPPTWNPCKHFTHPVTSAASPSSGHDRPRVPVSRASHSRLGSPQCPLMYERGSLPTSGAWLDEGSADTPAGVLRAPASGLGRLSSPPHYHRPGASEGNFQRSNRGVGIQSPTHMPSPRPPPRSQGSGRLTLRPLMPWGPRAPLVPGSPEVPWGESQEEAR